MIYWMIVIAVIISFWLMSNDGGSFLRAFVVILGGTYVIVLPITMYANYEVATTNYCSEENITVRQQAIRSFQKQNIKSLQIHGLNDQSLDNVRIWTDMVNDEQKKIDECYNSAQLALNIADTMLLYDWMRDKMPEHLVVAALVSEWGRERGIVENK